MNLGTNDATQIYFSSDKKAATEAFRKNYRAFVREIRALNGPDAVIVCALGCMDYYLFDEIQAAVDDIRIQTGDQHLFTMKYGKMLFDGPDAGGCLHPTIYRQQLMAQELADRLRTLNL